MADDAFLRGCDVAIGSPAADVAIVVRRVLGHVRGAPPETIRADDAFADHFWDSLDWLDVTFRIEKELVAKVSQRRMLDEAVVRAGGDRRAVRVRDVVQGAAASLLPMQPAPVSGSRAATATALSFPPAPVQHPRG